MISKDSDGFFRMPMTPWPDQMIQKHGTIAVRPSSLRWLGPWKAQCSINEGLGT